VAFQNFEEVWAALGRLYSDIVRMQESQQQVTAQLAQVGERMDRLVESQDRMISTVSTLAGTVTQLAAIVDSHEKRLERLEGQ
jgi:DNA anti-recombination protein RmuC